MFDASAKPHAARSHFTCKATRDHRGLGISSEASWSRPDFVAGIDPPCFWHPHIQAGDLGSHVYNAWLAQLVGQGHAPGVYVVRQWNNVLFDIALLPAAKIFGWHAAELLVVAVGVLTFFWGAFALVGAISKRAPWMLVPCFAMLAYGYSFSMAF